MASTPLIIDYKALANLKSFGEAHPLNVDEVRKVIAGEAPVAGDREGYSLNMDFGYRVVFSIEQIPLKDGSGVIWLRRMSMSQVRPGRVPNLPAVHLVSEALGFPDLEKCYVDLEDDVVMVVCEQDASWSSNCQSCKGTNGSPRS